MFLNISLDKKSKIKLYRQLFDAIVELIKTKELKENTKLPSVRTVSKELDIGKNTVTKAYLELEKAEYIYSVEKSGYFGKNPDISVPIKKENRQSGTENKADSTMQSPLNLDGHDITKVKMLDANKAQFEEKLSVEKIATNTLGFTNRSTIDAIYTTNTAVVYGALTADARVLNVRDTLTLADSARFSSFYTNDLYVNNLSLNGMSVKTDSGKESVLRIVGDLDLILGHINADYVSVGYAGSVTPRLSISDKIQDSKDSSFYWDIKSKKARMADLMLPELSRMAQYAFAAESKKGTESTTLFGGVVANSNATVADYINAINEIQKRVKAKYEMLKL